MSRTRARALVGLAAAASAALVVGVTVLQAEDGGSSEPAPSEAERRPPPLELGLPGTLVWRVGNPVLVREGSYTTLRGTVVVP